MAVSIQLNPMPPPTEEPSDFVDGSFCFALSPSWFGILQGSLGILQIRAIWEEMTDEAWIDLQYQIAEVADMTCGCGIENLAIDEDGKVRVKIAGVWFDPSGESGSGTDIYVNTTKLVSENYYGTVPAGGGQAEDDLSCGIALNMTEYVFERLRDTYDAIDAASNLVSALDVVLLAFPPLYLLVDQVLDMLVEIESATTAALRALDTVDQRETTECALYVYMQGESGELTEENYAGFVQEFADSCPSLLADVVGFFFGSIANTPMLARASMYANIGDAAECVLCTQCSTFVADDVDGWEVVSGSVDVGACTGESNLYVGPGGGLIKIWRHFDPPVLVTNVELTDTHLAGTVAVRGYLWLEGELMLTFNSFDGPVGAISCDHSDWPIASVETDLVAYWTTTTAALGHEKIKICYKPVI